MRNTTTTATQAQFTLTFAWGEFAGFTGGAAVTTTETDEVTVTAATAAEARTLGLRMLAQYDEGTALTAVTPA